ncbi:MAG: protein-disulfide reductase DsbD N-terminal domain-containing protein [Acidobacteriaceae bacterium]
MKATCLNRTRLTFAPIVSLVFILATTAHLGHAQLGMDAPAKPKSTVLYAAEPQSVPAARSSLLELRFQIVPGFHINSHTPNSQFLIPTALTLQPADGVKLGAPQYPAGVPFSFPFDPGVKVDVYSGSFTVKLPVVATAGDHAIDGTLKYQACDNASCYPPKTLPVRIVFTAK